MFFKKCVHESIISELQSKIDSLNKDLNILKFNVSNLSDDTKKSLSELKNQNKQQTAFKNKPQFNTKGTL